MSAPLEQAQQLVASGQAPRAREVLRFALLRAPHDAALLRGLAAVEMACGDESAGVATARKVYDSAPADLASLDTLTRILLEVGDPGGAWEAFERSAVLVPGRAETYWLWLQAGVRSGCIEQAVRAGRRGVAAVPGSRDLMELLCYALNFADGTDPDEHTVLHRRLGELVTQGRPATTTFANARDPEKRLRVAFLSGDVCFHACAFFLAGPLTRLDRTRVEPLVYAANVPDETSRAFAGVATYWDCSRVNDEGVGARALADGVDVVVECSGWTSRGRVPSMAGRIAPLQVSYLGYPNTTGLPAMDYRIVDSLTDPPGSERWASERLLRMDGCFLCYQSAAATPGAGLSEYLAARAEGRGATTPFTFGSFSRLAKVQDECLRLWVRVLEAVPGSRLLLKTDASRAARRLTEGRFTAAGGDVSRLAWAGFEPDPSKHLSAYAQIDVALDAMPYQGTTTTCEALLMGVPVVSLAGRTHRERVGASLLTAVGLPEWVAADPQAYIGIAAGLAADPGRLVEWHRTLRGRVLGSSLCDAAGHAARFERVLREAWRGWCAQRPGV